MSATPFREGQIVIYQHAFGPLNVRILTVYPTSNTAVIQYRDLDKTPSEQNVYTVMLQTLRAK